MTYGAGGSTKGKTVEIASTIKNQYNIEAVAHLTCISSTESEILDICQQLKDNHIENILSLRGDYPQDGLQHELSFHYAKELNTLFHNIFLVTFVCLEPVILKCIRKPVVWKMI